MNRREFMQTAAASIGAIPTWHAMAEKQPTPRLLRVAVIGCGSYGCYAHIPASLGKKSFLNTANGASGEVNLGGQKLMAVVDPDERAIAHAMKRAKECDPDVDTSKIRKYDDYRKMYDDLGKELDAVIIATPIHQHALPALMAMRRGINVYLEKPLAHTIAEVRLLTEEARKCGVATQMGNWGQSSEGTRLLREYYEAGAIGNIREVHCWSDRVEGCPPGFRRPPARSIPKELNWDSWLGPAPKREFHDQLLHFKWNKWHDFGCATLGNMGCHIINHAYWALNLKSPIAVELEEVWGGGDETWPVRSRIRWDFPARGTMPPLKLYWYDGIAPGKKFIDEWRMPRELAYAPPIRTELEKRYDREFTGEGSLFVGDKGYFTMGRHGDAFRIVPESAHRAFKRPPRTLPRIRGSHQDDFFQACRGGRPACSNFDHGGPLTELVLLGNIAQRAGVGKRIEWDSKRMCCTNYPELNQYVTKTYREGWTLS